LKKNTLLILIIVIIIACISCSKPEPQITYLEEFPHIPRREGMTLDDLQEAEEGQFSQATYTLKDANYENFLTQYKDLLIKDGWEVIQDEPPRTLSMGKGERIAVFILDESDSNLRLMLLSK